MCYFGKGFLISQFHEGKVGESEYGKIRDPQKQNSVLMQSFFLQWKKGKLYDLSVFLDDFFS